MPFLGKLFPKKLQILILFTLFFQLLPLNLQIFAIFFSQKMLILTIFSQKSAILKNFPILKVKNMGKFFHNFFASRGKNNFFGRIFTYVNQAENHYQLKHQVRLKLQGLPEIEDLGQSCNEYLQRFWRSTL